MDNHYHLLLETPYANLSKAMHYLNTSYSNYFKAKYSLVGSIFQGRYKSIVVNNDAYLLVLSAYIHLNPVRAAIVKSPEEYHWSSYSNYISRDVHVSWLRTDIILENYDINEYHAYVINWHNRHKSINTEEIYGKNGVLGSDEFIEDIKDRVRTMIKYNNKSTDEYYEAKHLLNLSKDDIEKILIEKLNILKEQLYLKKRGNILRLLFIYGLKQYTGMTLREIGSVFDIKYTTVSSLVNMFILKSENNVKIKQYKEKLDNILDNSN
jgi:hypothetical protein